MVKTERFDGADPSVRKTVLFTLATEGASSALYLPRARRVALFCLYDGSPTAGEVVLESGPEEEFVGNWAEEGASTAKPNGYDRLLADGPFEWVRARFKVPVVGGRATVYLQVVEEEEPHA